MGTFIALLAALSVADPSCTDMGTGTIVDSKGNRDAADTRRRDADWCAYYGEIEGVTEGLAIIPFRHRVVVFPGDHETAD